MELKQKNLSSSLNFVFVKVISKKKGFHIYLNTKNLQVDSLAAVFLHTGCCSISCVEKVMSP